MFKKKYFLVYFLLFQILFLKLITFFPEMVEKVYSNGMYVYISKTNRILFGKILFSVGDVLYGFLILYCFYWFYKNRKIKWKQKLLSIASFVSVFYFFFHFLWAFNYYRLPLYVKMNIEREYSEDELVAFTEKLILKSNEVQLEITKKQNQKVINPYSQETIFKMTQNGYDLLAKQYPFFEYQIPSQKKSLFSLPLTYMGFGGYLNPFSGEAQVNYKLPKYGFPNVICHEMAHQIGYGSESECNFIGFLAGIKNENLYFKYAAYSNALTYCMRTIEETNQQKFEELKLKINKGILNNYKESEIFWKQYDTIIDKGFHAFYDQYLKANQQKDGIESYSRFVDLLVNYYKHDLVL